MIWCRCMAVCLWLGSCLALAAAPPDVCRLDSIMGDGGTTPAGIWQIGGDGAVFEIVPEGADGCFCLRIIDSPDYSVALGAVFGTMTYTGTERCYDATLFMKPRLSASASLPGRKQYYVFDFAADGASFRMKRYRKGWSLNVLRALPYLFRISVREHDNRPTDIDGARRIAPVATPQHIVL